MGTEEKIGRLTEGLFQELFGVKKPVFEKMPGILKANELGASPRGGRPPKLKAIDKLVIMLEYYHDYPTMSKLACFAT